jgi:uncharacterized protein YjiS (DUF1127 family)
VGIFARIRNAVDTVLASWAKAREYQTTFNELDALCDRELADIGLRRGDIADIAREHVYGR